MNIKREGFVGQKLIRLPENVRKQLALHPITAPLFLTDIGFYPPVSNHQVIRKKPIIQQVLIYCTDGEGWCRIGKTTYTIKKDTYFVLPGGTPHAYGNKKGGQWAIYWLHFNGQLAADYAGQLCDKKFGRPIPLIPRKELMQLFHETVADLENGLTLEGCSYASARLSHMLGEIAYHRRFTTNQDKSTIESAIAFMKQKVEEQISIGELAAYLNLSITHFSRLFKKRTGQSPIDYFIHLKIQRACQYLDFTGMTVQDVAHQMGYDDAYYFSRVFKRVMGTAPLHYRTDQH